MSKSKSKIVFFTRNKPDDTLAQYQRIQKLMSLFNKAFEKDVVLFNTYDESLSHSKLILKSKKKIKAYLKAIKYKIDSIVIDTLDPWSIAYLNRYALKRNIKVYIDIVEYADPKEKKFGYLSPSLLLNHRVIKHSVKKNMKVIAISSFFTSYYDRKGIKSVLIPNMINEEDDYSNNVKKRLTDKVHFIFAGYPQKKDALDVTMQAMIALNKQYPDHFCFHIAGLNEEEFFEKYKKLKKNRKEIQSFTAFHGFVRREAIKSLYYKSDFSIIMRDPSMKVCQSGFPTKFSESLSFARPVISNLTSDIGLYLTHKMNGYVVTGFNKESLLTTLKLALEKKAHRKEMFANAYECAKRFFSPSMYIERLRGTEDVQK